MTPEDPTTPMMPVSRGPGRLDYATHLVLGLCVVAVGVALTLDRLQILEADRILRFWPVAIILLGASIAAQAFWPTTDPARLEVRRRTAAGPLFIVAMITIAFLIAPRIERRARFVRSDTKDSVSLLAIMSADRRVSYSSEFHGGDMTSFMGGCALDLRQATIAPGQEAVIDVFAMMGGVELRVPEGWVIDVRTVPVMGGVSDQRRGGASDQRRRGRIQRGEKDDDSEPPAAEANSAPAPSAPGGGAAGAPRLVIRGFIMMGGLVIKA